MSVRIRDISVIRDISDIRDIRDIRDISVIRDISDFSDIRDDAHSNSTSYQRCSHQDTQDAIYTYSDSWSRR